MKRVDKSYKYVWVNRRRPDGRRGQRCKKVGKGKVPGQVKVRFPTTQQGHNTYYVLEDGLVKLHEVEAEGGFKAWLASRLRRK